MTNKNRSNQYFELGVRGRKTGWTSKPNLKRDSDGLANIDDFFDSEPEIQEFSSDEDIQEHISQNILPAARQHRMTRDERRQERFRHRGRQRVPSEEIAQELFQEEEENHADHSPGFFEEDQVTGFLPTRPLARTPLAIRNDAGPDQTFSVKSRSAMGYGDGYHEDMGRYESPARPRRNDVYESQDVEDDEYRMDMPISRAVYSVKRQHNNPASPRVGNDGYFSDNAKHDVSQSPLQTHVRRESKMYNRDGYQNSPKVVVGRMNRSRSLASNDIGGQSYSPRVNRSQLKYPESSNSYEEERLVKKNGERISRQQPYHPEQVDYDHDDYPEDVRKKDIGFRNRQVYQQVHDDRDIHDYPEERFSKGITRSQSYNHGHDDYENVGYPEERLSKEVKAISRRQSYNHGQDDYKNAEYPEERLSKEIKGFTGRQSYHPEQVEYENSDYPRSDRRIRKSLSYPETHVRPLSQKELESSAPYGSRPHSRASIHMSSKKMPQSPSSHHEYNDYTHGTPSKNHRLEGTTYEEEIARSLSLGKNRIQSTKSQKVSVEDIQERFEGGEYNDFPDQAEDQYAYDNYETNEAISQPIEEAPNPVVSKRGRPKGKKNTSKSFERKLAGEKTEKQAVAKKPVKRTLYPSDLKADDQEEDPNGMRKSKRVKIPPLAYWRNEKIVYGRRDSGYCPVPVMKEVIRIESDSENNPLRKKSDSKKETLKIEKTDLPVINYITQKEEDQQIVVTPDMIDPRTVGAGDYRFQKVFSEGEFLASGVLYLPKGSQKPNKNSNSSAMIFVVMAGQVQVQIHKTIFTVGTGAQFFVPRGNQYRISNAGTREARIFFCHGKEVNGNSTD